MVTIPIYQSRSEEIGDAFIEHVFSTYSIPEWMIIDQGISFMSTLINYVFKKWGIKIKTISPYNHLSSQAEHGVKSLATILTKHLTGLGQYWSKYLPFAMYSYNTYFSPNLSGFTHMNYFLEEIQATYWFWDGSKCESIRRI